MAHSDQKKQQIVTIANTMRNGIKIYIYKIIRIDVIDFIVLFVIQRS